MGYGWEEIGKNLLRIATRPTWTLEIFGVFGVFGFD